MKQRKLHHSASVAPLKQPNEGFVPLENVCSFIRGVTYQKSQAASQPHEDKLPILRANNIGKGLNFEDLVYVDKSCISPQQILQKDDVVVAMSSGSKSVVGKTARFDHDWQGSFGAFCGVLRPNNLVDSRYFGFFFQSQSYRQAATALSSGTNINNLKPSILKKLDFPFIRLERQRLVASKLDQMMPRVRSAQERIETANRMLRKFRESIIESACSGRLIHSDIEDDDLPAGWLWLPLEDLVPKGGIFDGPFGSNLKTADYTKSGVRVIRLENISRLDFIASKETYVSQAKYETLKRHTVQKGDILFSSFIDEKIRVCVLPELQTKAIAKADCFCIRPDLSRCDVDFIAMQLGSQATSDALIGSVHGATRPRVNTKQLRKVAIRIGPLNEQQEIVRRAASLFADARKVEQAILKTEKGCDRTVSSVLAAAFRGELL